MTNEMPFDASSCPDLVWVRYSDLRLRLWVLVGRVVLELLDSGEGGGALDALEGALDLVHILNVLHQVTLLAKGTNAHLALKWLGAPVDDGHVLVEGAPRASLIRTDLTLVGFFLKVDRDYMLFQVRLLAKARGADVTLKRLLLQMHRADVLVQPPLGGTLVLAVVAGMRPLLVGRKRLVLKVNAQDVLL